MKFKTLFLTALLVLAFPIVTFAQSSKSSDRNKPLEVEANSVVYTDITQTSVFTGNVIAKQGTMEIRADHIETIVDPEGYQYATATMDNGGLVHFSQRREGTNELIKAQGEKLVYDGKQNLVVLSNKAQMRRLTPKGSLIDQIDGNELVYNQLTEVFESHDLPDVPGRTRVVITPRTSTK